MSKKTVSGTKEWASSNFNVMRGCANGCLYCYACANAIRFNQKEPGTWTHEEVNEKAAKRVFGLRDGTIMYPTTHDFTLANLEHTLPPLVRMLEAGNQVLVVSKPNLHVIWEMCEACEKYKDQILFRFTIGSGLDEVLSFWEPNAPAFMSRLESLSFAFEKGFKTSVSMEPLLDVVEDVPVGMVVGVEGWFACVAVLMGGDDGGVSCFDEAVCELVVFRDAVGGGMPGDGDLVDADGDLVGEVVGVEVVE